MFENPDEGLGFRKMTNYYGGGIDHFETPIDHRIHVAPDLNEKIDPAWRQPDGWYATESPGKSDGRASVVALSFPERFDPVELAGAHQDARDAYPEIYDRVVGAAAYLEHTRTAFEDEAPTREAAALTRETPQAGIGRDAVDAIDKPDVSVASIIDYNDNNNNKLSPSNPPHNSNADITSSTSARDHDPSPAIDLPTAAVAPDSNAASSTPDRVVAPESGSDISGFGKNEPTLAADPKDPPEAQTASAPTAPDPSTATTRPLSALMSAFDDAPASPAKVPGDAPSSQATRIEEPSTAEATATSAPPVRAPGASNDVPAANEPAPAAASVTSSQKDSAATATDATLPKAQPPLKDLMAAFDDAPVPSAKEAEASRGRESAGLNGRKRAKSRRCAGSGQCEPPERGIS